MAIDLEAIKQRKNPNPASPFYCSACCVDDDELRRDIAALILEVERLRHAAKECRCFDAEYRNTYACQTDPCNWVAKNWETFVK